MFCPESSKVMGSLFLTVGIGSCSVGLMFIR